MSNLTKTKDWVDRNTGEWSYSGNLKNLRVKGSAGYIWLTGSLAKFHLGSNIETLQREETARAIEHLSDELNQPMTRARVFRLDVAKTFVMERPPAEYWRCLLPPPRMKRIEYSNGDLTFRNGQCSIVFYDKLAEIRQGSTGSNHGDDNGELSSFTGHPYLLRYEVQFKHRLGQTFGDRDIRAARLSHPAFYEKVVRKWAAEYFKLGRISSIERPAGATVKSDVNFLAAVGLQSFGAQGYLEAVDSDLRAGLIDKHQASRRRAKIRELARGKGIMAAGGVLEELDTKVNQAVASCQ